VSYLSRRQSRPGRRIGVRLDDLEEVSAAFTVVIVPESLSSTDLQHGGRTSAANQVD
jgi:hypothetical protein